MSRFGAKKGRKLPGAEFTWEADPGGEADTAPTPLFPRYNVPRARLLNPREQKQVDLYRALRDRFHDGPYYSVLQSTSVTARKDEATRAHFDPFHGMPTYSGKYQKQKRDRPELKGRPYGKCCSSGIYGVGITADGWLIDRLQS
jgi:DNA-directed RNA polymerase III subunit RPC7